VNEDVDMPKNGDGLLCLVGEGSDVHQVQGQDGGQVGVCAGLFYPFELIGATAGEDEFCARQRGRIGQVFADPGRGAGDPDDFIRKEGIH